jgi:hypothetical protein
MGWAVRVAHKPRKPKVEKNRKLSVWFDTDKAAGRGGEKDGALRSLPSAWFLRRLRCGTLLVGQIYSTQRPYFFWPRWLV